MNLAQYDEKGQTLYGDFSAVVKFILEQPIAGGQVPQPQSIQCRAKSTADLKLKLEAQGILDSDSIEHQIKDLPGVRVILYTNTDVDRLFNSGRIQRGFEVDWKETRVH